MYDIVLYFCFLSKFNKMYQVNIFNSWLSSVIITLTRRLSQNDSGEALGGRSRLQEDKSHATQSLENIFKQTVNRKFDTQNFKKKLNSSLRFLILKLDF